jgi:hypothetical protein
MNLGIEYAIRSGEVKHHLSFPLSLFVTASPSREKSVVTIHPRRDGRLTVKRWRLGEARANEVLPPCDQAVVPAADVYDDPAVVLPMHDLMDYVEESTDSRRNRNPYQPFSAQEQEEYDQMVSGFLNSSPHRRARTEWLWAAFRDAFPFDVWSAAYETNPDNLLADHAPWLRRQWMAWRQTLLEVGGVGMVAAELAFHEAYEARRAAEHRSPPADPSWVGISPFNLFPFFRAARAGRMLRG